MTAAERRKRDKDADRYALAIVWQAALQSVRPGASRYERIDRVLSACRRANEANRP